MVDGWGERMRDVCPGVENVWWNHHEPYGLCGLPRRLQVRWRIQVLRVPRGDLLRRWGDIVQRLWWRLALRRCARVHRLQGLWVDFVHLRRVGRPPR